MFCKKFTNSTFERKIISLYLNCKAVRNSTVGFMMQSHC